MCSCGAGACTVNNLRDENGKETKYFTCRIRTVCWSFFFFLMFLRFRVHNFHQDFILNGDHSSDKKLLFKVIADIFSFR